MSDILTALSIKSLKNSNCAFDIIGNVSRYEKKLNKGSKWQRKHGHLVVLLADVDSVMCTLNGLMQGIILLFCTNSQCHKTQNSIGFIFLRINHIVALMLQIESVPDSC
jgi:hypothetical protein